MKIKTGSKYFLIIVITSVYFFSIFFQSCKQDFSNPVNSDSQFPQEIESIFNTPYSASNITCNTPSCHSGNSTASNLDLTNWNKTMSGSQNGTMVIPYNGFWSHMISVLNNDTLYAPVTTVTLPEYHKIDHQKVSVIMNWINEGAKSKDGQTAFTNVSNNEKGFITNQQADVIAVLKTNDKLVTRMIPVGGRSGILDSPHYITLSPDNRFFYVSLIQEGFIEKFDVNVDYPFTKTDRIQAGLNPAHISISNDGNTGYVTNFDASGTERMVRKFNTNPLQIIDTVTDIKMKAPHGMAISNNGQYLYVTSQLGEYIFKIDLGSFEIETSQPIDPSVPPTGNGTGLFKPYQAILSPDNSLLYVSCVSSNQVRVYNASDLTPASGNFNIQVGANPLLMKFTNNGNYLFVCNRNSNSVTVIKTPERIVETTVENVGIQPHGVDFTSDGQYAIIACETLSGFDGHHPTVGSNKFGVSRMINVQQFSLLPNKLEMGPFPAGIAVIK
ncbi:MAG: beta-propeller fold lactonase family protein [Ignavibacteria bacterium]|nr:beta-propeller fold lactonase family protein [Ignavibacteria bacterium]MBK9406272.1 beta-propeller fold lactonase family protein [Ignavibacteria bacterium]